MEKGVPWIPYSLQKSTSWYGAKKQLNMLGSTNPQHMYSKLIQYRDWNLEENKIINLDISEERYLLKAGIKDPYDIVEVFHSD